MHGGTCTYLYVPVLHNCMSNHVYGVYVMKMHEYMYCVCSGSPVEPVLVALFNLFCDCRSVACIDSAPPPSSLTCIT